MSAVPSNATPLIERAVASLVAVVALPLTLPMTAPVIVPATKFPLTSRLTIVFCVLALVAALARFAPAATFVAVTPPTWLTTVLTCVPVTSPTSAPVKLPALPLMLPVSGPLKVPVVVPPSVRLEAKPMVPLPVMVPPVRPAPAVMLVTVPPDDAAGEAQTQALPLYCSTCPLVQLLLASLAAVTAASAICAVPRVPVICDPATVALAANDSALAARIAYGLAASGCRGVISGSVPIVMPRVY